MCHYWLRRRHCWTLCRVGHAAGVHVSMYSPRFFDDVAVGRSGDNVTTKTKSNCFYHPKKRAACHCESCGCFLCALCQFELDGKRFCPACVEKGSEDHRLNSLTTGRALYDEIELSMAVLPVIFIFTLVFTIVTAPLTIVFAIRTWKKPTSIVPRSKLR